MRWKINQFIYLIMELQFKKVGSRYETEFEATGNFNLHCERKGAGNFKLFQKGTPEGQYATESSYADHKAEAVVDIDFSMLVYPKFIKVVSESEPIQGIVTMDGEGGSSGSGRGIRPVTADDFSSIVLSNSEVGSMDATFSDTITLTGQTTISIRLKNKKADLVQPVKEECQLIYSEDQDIYYYRNGSYAPTTFNMSQLYIKED